MLKDSFRGPSHDSIMSDDGCSDDFSDLLNEVSDKTDKIWNEMGVDMSVRTDKINTFVESLQGSLREFLRNVCFFSYISYCILALNYVALFIQEEKRRDELKASIEEKRKEIDKMAKVLGITPRSYPEGKTMLEIDNIESNEFKEIKAMYEAKSRDMQQLQATIESSRRLLDESCQSQSLSEKKMPTERNLEDLRSVLQFYQSKLNEATAKAAALWSRQTQLTVALGPCDNDEMNKLFEGLPNGGNRDPGMLTSVQRLEKLQNLVTEREAQLKKNKSEKGALITALKALYSELHLDQKDLESFIQSIAGPEFSNQVLNALREHEVKMRTEWRQSVGPNIARAIEQCLKYYSQMGAVLKKDSFDSEVEKFVTLTKDAEGTVLGVTPCRLDSFDGFDDRTALKVLEDCQTFEIKCKSRKQEHERYSKWLGDLEKCHRDKEELAALMSNPDRFKDKKYPHEQEAILRKSAEKNLPAILKRLIQNIDGWEDRVGTEFIYQGKRILPILQEEQREMSKSSKLYRALGSTMRGSSSIRPESVVKRSTQQDSQKRATESLSTPLRSVKKTTTRVAQGSVNQTQVKHRRNSAGKDKKSSPKKSLFSIP